MTIRAFVFLLCSLSLWAIEPPASDSQMESSLRERLAKSVVGKDGFTPRVKDGVVYWTGTTSVAQHKGAATRMAKSAGARRVVNNIQVSGAKPKEATVASAPSKPVAAKPPSPTPLTPATTAAPPKTEQATAPPKRAIVQWTPVQQH